jgi:hypothetical protein
LASALFRFFRLECLHDFVILHLHEQALPRHCPGSNTELIKITVMFRTEPS